MSTLAVAPAPAVTQSPTRKKFTRDEVSLMLNSGMLAGQRVELIDGDLIDKMGQNPPHANGILAVSGALAEVFGLKRLRIQLPMEIAAADRKLNDPEPDVAVLASEPGAQFLKRHPRADEMALVVEVADSTVLHDSVKKRDLYARAGAAEYWVLNVDDRNLIVHRKLSNGGYTETVILTSGEVTVPGSNGKILRVEDLL